MDPMPLLFANGQAVKLENKGTERVHIAHEGSALRDT